MRVLGVFQQFGTTEILIVLLLALLLFGAKRLPEIGRSFGKSLREFKDATKGLADDVKSGIEDEEPQKASSPERPAGD